MSVESSSSTGLATRRSAALRALIPLALAGLLLPGGAGCSPGTGLTCGAGTVQVGGQCVALVPPPDGGSAGDGGPLADRAVQADRPDSPVADVASADAPPDAAAGDLGPGLDAATDLTDAADGRGHLAPGAQCPDHFGTGCDGSLLFGCAVSSLTDPGTLFFQEDCAGLGGQCTESVVEGYTQGQCTGGGFGPCDNATYLGACYSDRFLQYCESGQIIGIDCQSDGQTNVCRTNAAGESYCVPPDATSCDDATYVDHCSDDGSLMIACNSGFLISAPCPTPGDICREGVAVGDPHCVSSSAQPCQPATYQRHCAGSYGVYVCDGSVDYEQIEPCFGGQVCRTGGEGAVCADPGAAACDISTFMGRCSDRTTAVFCSGGFESPRDCTAAGDGYRCVIDDSGRATCAMATDCDPASYQPNCQNGVAQNCDPMGYVRSQNCGSLAFCNVRNGTASCG
jgi:hypothetical protein